MRIKYKCDIDSNKSSIYVEFGSNLPTYTLTTEAQHIIVDNNFSYRNVNVMGSYGGQFNYMILKKPNVKDIIRGCMNSSGEVGVLHYKQNTANNIVTYSKFYKVNKARFIYPE